MKLTTDEGKTYIVKLERFHRFTIKLSVFIGAYYLWCLFWFIANITDIVLGEASLINVFSGSVHVLGLFLSAMWFDEVLNDV